MYQFKPGDIVQLKSGGPKMTVQRIIGENNNYTIKIIDEAIKLKGFNNGDVVCQWFDGVELKDGVFSKDTLQKEN